MNSKLDPIPRSELVIKTIEMMRHVTGMGKGIGFSQPQPERKTST